MWRLLLPLTGRRALPALLFGIVLATCAREASVQTASPADAPPAPYAFERPDTLFRLPGTLREISGLTVLDAHTLGAVQDEKGDLYRIDLRTGTIVDRRDFGKNLDYEGVERVGNAVWVLQSDGDLFEIEDWRADKLDADRHDTGLGAAYDTEGLAYDAAHHRLLIACKEYAGKDLDRYKAIYAFDLERRERLDAPAFLIDVETFREGVEADDGLGAPLRQALRPLMDLSGFKPSALAIHPLTGELYVLSSVLKGIAVLAPDGTMTAVWPLPDPPFEQPEGLAFLPDGTLFIASEGVGKKAVLARFAYRPDGE